MYLCDDDAWGRAGRQLGAILLISVLYPGGIFCGGHLAGAEPWLAGDSKTQRLGIVALSAAGSA